MPEPGFPNDTPQFGTAEYPGKDAGDICKVCRQPVTGVYYRVISNNALLCGSCAERVQREVPKDSHAAFVRALLFGIGGFVLGLVLYAGFTIATGLEIGFVSLAVGWLVGKAMMKGSGGIGGRRYQVAAVALTYAAVSMAFIPIVLYYASKEKAKQPQVREQPADSSQASQGDQPPQPSTVQPSPENTRPKQNFAAALGQLTLLGLTSPFLQLKGGFSGIIGLFILFIGMQFAWKITRGQPKIVIDGPFQISSAAKA
jgi:hypothetical protein